MKVKSTFFSLFVLLMLMSFQAFSQAETVPKLPLSGMTIVIDPGHGGKDPGAISKRKVKEKDIVFQIAKRLAERLRKKAGATVFLTRSQDRFVTLGYRNRFANQKDADLFLSIHANAAKNQKAKGIELYYLNKATDQASRRLAQRENAGAPQEEKEIEAILSDLIQTASTEESAELASYVQKSLQRSMKEKKSPESVEIKTALFYVLVGAKCPSLLIETGFVTNPGEGKKLKQPAYQQSMVNSVADGVVRFFEARDQPKSDL